jgi:hypothetical protein
MKSKLHLTAVAICMMVAGTASAAISGYVSNPTTNSIDWGNSVTALGATINTSVNFNSIVGTGAVTPSIGGTYTASDGVTFSASNINLAATMSPQGFTFSGEGEGVWTPSKLLVASSAAMSSTPAQSVTFTFQNAVYGGGVFLVDLHCCTQWTISARDTNNQALGSFQSLANAGFGQTNAAGAGKTHKYFLGISSTEANIASLTISRPAMSMFVSGDTAGLDDFRFAVAAIPEPAEWTMLIAGLLVVGFIARRRRELRFE